MTILNCAVVEGKRAQRDYSEADWKSIVASLSESTVLLDEACEVCRGLASYEGRACADSHVVKLCKRCLDTAIYKLSRMRDDAMLETGCEPVCNRCWRPILDPRTHMELRSLLG
jgi:hypothetical protein